MSRLAAPVDERTRKNGSLRLRAIRVLARRRLFEHLLVPATWVLAALGLVLAFLIDRGFVRSVDSTGLSFSLHPAYEILYGIMGSAFGATYAWQIFGDGPFAFASLAALAPLLLYLCLATIQRFGHERDSGIADLVAAGPADIPAYLFSFGAADAVVAAAYLVLTGLFLAVNGIAWNLVIGLTLVAYLLGLLLFAASLLGLALLLASSLRRPASAVALFLVVAAALALAEVASFAVVGGGPGGAGKIASWVLRWLSPFYYLDAARMAVRSEQTLQFFGALLGQAALCAAFLTGAHATARSGGTR